MQNGTVNPTSELKSADENWSKASEAKSLDQFMSFVVDDVYDSGPDGKWIHGKAAIRDRWSKMLTDPGFKLTWTIDKADVSKVDSGLQAGPHVIA
jgi:ketosteroid isomerase-like protein